MHCVLSWYSKVWGFFSPYRKRIISQMGNRIWYYIIKRILDLGIVFVVEQIWKRPSEVRYSIIVWVDILLCFKLGIGKYKRTNQSKNWGILIRIATSLKMIQEILVSEEFIFIKKNHTCHLASDVIGF